MDTKDIPHRFPSPWRPEQNQKLLGVLGKSVEELGELLSIIGRCIIQGIAGKHPETGKANRQALSEEVGDVLAKLQNIIEAGELDSLVIASRAEKKFRFLAGWLQTLDADHDGWFALNSYNVPREVTDGDIPVHLWLQPNDELDDISKGKLITNCFYTNEITYHEGRLAPEYSVNWRSHDLQIPVRYKVMHWRYATNTDAITTPVLA